MTVRRRLAGLPSLVGLAATRAVGELLGQALGLVGVARGDKPLHPRGAVQGARLVRYGSRRPWDVPFLDEPGEDRCLVRASRAMGLPPPLPDIHGLAVRIDGDGAVADLLFATTGTGRLGRYVLRLRGSARAHMTTLLPVRTPRGPLALRLTPGPPGQWLLSTAGPGSRRWETVARLVTSAERGGDRPVRFDPIRNLPIGVHQYPWARALRDPAYVIARRRTRAQGTR